MGRAFEFRKGRKMKRWSAMAKAFTRIGKDIVMAVKEGGPNPDANSRLRAVIQNAKAANMPKENVERAIKKATDKDTANYKEVLFEGYAPHGIALLIETATDNKNRTVSNIKHILAKHEGNLGAAGSVSWQFSTMVQLIIANNMPDKDGLELKLIDSGAEELREQKDQLAIYITIEKLDQVKNDLLKQKIEVIEEQIVRKPNQMISLDNQSEKEVIALIEELGEHEDVTDIHTNANITL